MSEITKVPVGAKVRSVRQPQFRRVGITFTHDERTVKLDEITPEQLDYLLAEKTPGLLVEPILGTEAERAALVGKRAAAPVARVRTVGEKTTAFAVTNRSRLKAFRRVGIDFEQGKTQVVDRKMLTDAQADFLLNSDERDLLVVELSGKAEPAKKE